MPASIRAHQRRDRIHDRPFNGLRELPDDGADTHACRGVADELFAQSVHAADDHQHLPADNRLLRGQHRGGDHPHADPAAGGEDDRDRSDTLRADNHGEPGLRLHLAAIRDKPLRRLRDLGREYRKHLKIHTPLLPRDGRLPAAVHLFPDLLSGTAAMAEVNFINRSM